MHPTPLQVKILTNHLACGQEVTIDLDPAASKADIRARLEAVTGVPAQHQKLLLSGINQIVMGDKRCVGGCGLTARRGGWGGQLASRCGSSAVTQASRPLPPTCLLPPSCLPRSTNIGFSHCGSTNGVQMAVNSK